MRLIALAGVSALCLVAAIPARASTWTAGNVIQAAACPTGVSGNCSTDSGKSAPTGTFVGTTDTQTLTNKTLTAPVMTAPLLGTPASGDASNLTNIPVNNAKSGAILPAANGGTGVASPTVHTVPINEGSSAQNHVVALTNGQIVVGQTGADPAAETVGGDATLSAAGSLIVTKTNGIGFAASATTDATNAANISSGRLPLAQGGSRHALLGSLIGANMNSTADQTIALTSPTGTTKFVPTQIIYTNASISLTTAAGALYSAASKSGPLLGTTATSSFSYLTTSSLALSVGGGPAQGNAADQTELCTSSCNVFLSLTTAQGATATVDVYVFGDVLQ